jgi:glucosamine-6-phosphate deaminase
MIMNLIVVEDYAALSQAAADWVVGQIANNPKAVAVFPTGSTPLGLYEELSQRRAVGRVDASGLQVRLLDEYADLPPEDPYTFANWLTRKFLQPMGISPAQLVLLPRNSPQIAADCARYDAELAAAGGLDFAVLGLGPNGHLGYNDPPAAGDEPTRLLNLSESSIETAVGYFDGDRARVPHQAITMGMAPLLAARQILLIVSGAGKRTILQQALSGPITPEVPASYLQQVADKVTVIADRAAYGAV